VTDWAVVFLGVMAVSLTVMTAIQIGLIIVGIRVARQVGVAVDDLRREIRPLSEKVNRIADDTARATSLVVLQVERLDQLMASTATRVEEILGILQAFASGPLRQGTAALAAVRAVMSIVRDWKGRRPTARDDEDPLFVG
jgi:hypothetical protein